jgi:hypothetical protein
MSLDDAFESAGQGQDRDDPPDTLLQGAKRDPGSESILPVIPAGHALPLEASALDLLELESCHQSTAVGAFATGSPFDMAAAGAASPLSFASVTLSTVHDF